MNETRHAAILPLLGLAIIALAIATACQAAPTALLAATPRRATVEGGIADIQFEQRVLLLDQRAAPYAAIQLAENAELLTGAQQAISLLDLRDGDYVRAEGQTISGNTFLATRVTLVRATGRTIATPTPSLTPLVSPTPSATPPMLSDDRLPLPGNLIIADSANNRVIEVAADKKIVWEFPMASASVKFAAPDSAHLTPNGNTLLVNSARYHQVVEIDYPTRQIVWTFGEWGVAAGDDKHLNTPGAALRLPDRRTLIADSRNCRVVIVTPEKKIGEQVGRTGQCKSDSGLLARPSGIALLPNGNWLVTEIGARRVSEIDPRGQALRSVSLSIPYPFEAQPTRAGNILVAAYDKPGRLIEVDWSGQIVWEYFPKVEVERLDRPSVALELPNGNIAFSDDYNHRVAVVTRAGKLVWQYGVTGVAGKAPGYLNVPAGIDWRVRASAPTIPPPSAPPKTVTP